MPYACGPALTFTEMAGCSIVALGVVSAIANIIDPPSPCRFAVNLVGSTATVVFGLTLLPIW
jgi:hypothetical protein